MSEPKHECVFCGKLGRRSKEHVFPQWLRKYLPSQTGNFNHVVTQNGDGVRKGKLSRPGAMFSQTLRIACAECNNGWMSQLQEKAKPIISQLILGQWPVLDQSDQDLLAAWIAMLTCVYEFADPDTAMIPQSHRAFLCQNSKTPIDWSIWIGKFGASDGNLNTHANHFGAKLSLHPAQGGKIHFFQSTGFSIGKLLIQTLTDTPPGLFYRDLFDFEEKFGMYQIYPFKCTLTRQPALTHNAEGFYQISNRLASMLGLPCYRFPPN